MTSPNHWKVPRVSGADIWGYGRYGDDQLLPLSFDDIERDTAAGVTAVSALGLPDRAIVVVTSTVADVAYFHPVQSAAKGLGLLVCNADASAMDVDRVEMFARLLTVAAVIGVNDALVDGVLERGHALKSFFSSIPMVIAGPGARGRLVAAGVDALAFQLLGPVMALSCRRRKLHVDGRQWAIDEEGDTLHVSSRARRALPFDHFDTGIAGSVSHDVCPCGRRDPIVVIEGSPESGEAS